MICRFKDTSRQVSCLKALKQGSALLTAATDYAVKRIKSFDENSVNSFTARLKLTWHNTAWAEGNLLRLVVEIADRGVNHHTTNWLPWELLLRPVLQENHC